MFLLPLFYRIAIFSSKFENRIAMSSLLFSSYEVYCCAKIANKY